MDKKLQKEILIMSFKKSEHIISEEEIIRNIKQVYFDKRKHNEDITIPENGNIKQQINLLIDDCALIRITEAQLQSSARYRITKWGELRAAGGFKKFWYWLIYKKHNLISFISLILAIIAIIVSISK